MRETTDACDEEEPEALQERATDEDRAPPEGLGEVHPGEACEDADGGADEAVGECHGSETDTNIEHAAGSLGRGVSEGTQGTYVPYWLVKA
jgi:hypothetical protein